ncbi:hypothetical protein BGZ94_008249, partial [Podila epigama]
MEVNKDEALRCLDIARRHLQNANFASARKFGQKSISLYPTPDATQFLKTVDIVEKASASASTSTSASASSSTSASSSSNTTSSSTSANATASNSSASRPSQPERARSAPVVDHKPVERDYTPEQAAAVKAIRSSGGDFYKVLGVSKSATDIEIKKAYRKVALQMHPDKNGAPGADEAFKIVSKAFTVLSDPQKRAIFDQHGPDEGKSSGVNYDRANPAAQHFHRGGGFGEELSPEDLFNIFFGGGQFGGSFHSRQFGGRPGQASAQAQRQRQQQQQYFRQRQQRQRQQADDGVGISVGNLGNLIQLLPLILLLIISVTSGLLGSDSSSRSNSATTDFSLQPESTYTTARHTTFRHVPYFVNEHRFMNTYFPGVSIEKLPGARQINVPEDHIAYVKNQNGVKVPYKVGHIFKKLEDNVEVSYLNMIREKCRVERRRKDIAHNKAMGFWGADRKLWAEAQKMTTPHCDI